MSKQTGISTHTVLVSDGMKYVVTAEWLETAGRLEPLALRIAVPDPKGDFQPLTAQGIRRLPLGTAIAEMRRLAIRSSKSATAQSRRSRKEDHGPQRGRSLTEEQLGEVALTYIGAYEAGSPVTLAVAQRFGVSRSTAAKRIMAARAAGFLDGIGR